MSPSCRLIDAKFAAPPSLLKLENLRRNTKEKIRSSGIRLLRRELGEPRKKSAAWLALMAAVRIVPLSSRKNSVKTLPAPRTAL